MDGWIEHDAPDDYCFGCGQRNESGLRLRYRRTGEGSVEAQYSVPAHFRGAEGIVHGGIQATLLDEIMGLAAHSSLSREEHRIVTAELSVRYRRPVPIKTVLWVRGHLARVEGSNLFLSAEIADGDGAVLTEAEGRWKRL